MPDVYCSLVSTTNERLAGCSVCNMARGKTELNRHLQDTLNKWKEDTSDRGITLVTTGRSGAGKSTLIKNMLSLRGETEEEVPKDGHGPKPTTIKVRVYQAELHGVMVRIVDMPGLAAASEQNEKEILKQLEKITERKADMLLYCVSMLPNSKIDNTDKRIILMLTKAFGEDLWKRAILVLTFANVIMSLSPQQSMKELIDSYAQAFQEVLHSTNLTNFNVKGSLTPDKSNRDPTNIAALPAGKCRDEVIIKGARWDDHIYLEVLKKCSFNAIPALLCLKGIQVDKLQAIIASIGGVGVSAVIGGGAGAGIGALVGGLAGFGVGAIPGAIIGGGIGVGASTIATSSIVTTMAAIIIGNRIEEEKLKKSTD